jgi:hypothetical protein
MTQRFYFDTSVFGGVYDIEFDTLSTRLFDRVKSGEIICVYSELTVGELDNAPQRIRDFFSSLPEENTEYIQLTDEALSLAHQYIAEKVAAKQVLTIAYTLHWLPFTRQMCWSVGTSNTL